MRTPLWWATWGTLLAAPTAAVIVLTQFAPRFDRMWVNDSFHFYAVSVTALMAATTCGLLIASARSLRETRLLFLALAFLSIAAIFAVHGLSTPGFIHDQFYPSLSVSSWLSVFVGTMFITASAVELPEHVAGWVRRNGAVIFLATVGALAAYIFSAVLTESGWLAWLPVDDRKLQLGIASLVLAMLAFSAWRYLQAYFFARLPSHWAVVVALALLINVQVSMAWGPPLHLSWWLYHGLYALAFVSLFAGWGLEALRAGNLKVVADGLSMRDALAELNRGRPTALIELTDTIEAKDIETLGHVSRVAAYALTIGRELKLPAWELRSLVLAAQMHDVGKIGTPDGILCKNGPLTEEEFDIVKRHTVRGGEIARRVDALRALGTAIRHHHERVDGAGYPDGLRGDEIPLLSRIIAVADTYDALTSGRPYREAVDRAAALAELRRVQGSQLDPRCVNAFIAGLSKAESVSQEAARAA